MTWASEKGYSQRRACRLVGLEPKTYAMPRGARRRGVAGTAEGTGLGTPAVRIPAPALLLRAGGLGVNWKKSSGSIARKG